MLYITEVSKDKKFIKVIYSLDRPDIVFIWNTTIIINAINNGHRYMTSFQENGKYVSGSEVGVLVADTKKEYLVTHKNKTIEDNLNKLKRF